MGDDELSYLTLDEFEPSLGEGAVTRANVAEAVVAGCRRKLLLERRVELEALRRGFTFDSRMDLALQLARSWSSSPHCAMASSLREPAVGAFA